ncbi:MAG TPA: hypothetical protein VER08_07475 [Pyrinomonadaceae bacterium]|nr:hypothetical protein [Pyrinomonadaceae bacterium]
MFCQHCGAEATHELNYCKRCGGNLNPAGSQDLLVRPVVPPATVWGIGATTFLLVAVGLIILFGFISLMADRGMTPPALVTMTLFGALTLLGCVALLVRLWRLLLTGGQAQAVPRPVQLARPTATNELPPQRAGALPEAFGPVPSVTEHTTRTFDPAYREPRQR